MAEKLEKSNVQEIIELNTVQKGMFYHHLKDVSENTYNLQLSFSIEGDLKVDVLKEAFGLVQSKNEALRSVFRWEGLSTPVQIILKECPIDISYHNLSQSNAEETSAFISKVSAIDQSDRFDLTKLPIKVRVIKASKQAYILNISNHHILYDGWSTGVFLKEVFQCYSQISIGQRPEFKQKASYKEVQKSLVKAAHSETSKEFWSNYLKGHERTSLFSHSKGESNDVKKQVFTTSGTKLVAYAKEHQVTQASVIYAAYGILLRHYTSTKDVTFGTVVANRNPTIDGIDNVIGNFINTVPLRIKHLENTTISRVVTDVNQGLIERNNFNNTSLLDIKELLDINVDSLYDSIIAIENYPLDEEVIKGSNSLEIKLRSVYENTNFPLVITVFFKERVEVEFIYKKDLASDQYIQSLANNFIVVLENILDNGTRPVSTLSLSLGAEEHALLKATNDTYSSYPKDKTVLDLFEMQVEKTPENIALIFGGENITYRKLSELTNRIASFLYEKRDVRRNDLVGVMLERELNLIPVIFGVLKAGAAYVPVDVHYPEDRKNTIIEDAELKALITRGRYLSSVTSVVDGLVDLDEALDEIKTQHIEKSVPQPRGNDLAYVIYTSGSTGKPKGVMIEHHSVVNRILWMQKKYPITQGDVLLQKTPIVFDVSVWELFWWSLTGASLCLLKPGEEKDPEEITRTIKDHGVTTIHFVPSMLSTFLLVQEADFPYQDLASLKQVFVSGEALKPKLVDMFGETIHKYCGTRLINLYGPTEATVDVSYHECSFEDKAVLIPIGKPIDNTTLHILDQEMNPVPVGVTGELHIAGAGLARGYLNRKALTDQKFVENPFAKGKLIYKTGDLVRWLPDGNIDFLGRIDDQVKIRGFRIELGEIETELLKQPALKEAVVLAKGEDINRFLVAYYVAEHEQNITELKNRLSAKIPGYMIPDHFIQMESMPINANGKLDRKALPEPIMAANLDYLAPANDIEHELVSIWSDILKLEKTEISVTQTYMELGGHSLRIMLMLNRIFKQFKVVVSINDIFEHSSIRALGKHLQKLKKIEFFNLKKATQKEHYKLSAAQKRLHFLYEFDRSSLAYNGGTTLFIEGKLDKDRLEKTIVELIARHEILRSSFVLVDEVPVQRVSSKVDFEIEHFETKEEEIERVINKFTRPFDLAKAPLMRVGLIKVGSDKHILMVDMHHIISDGSSGEILIKEFMAIYNGGHLPELSLHYKDFAEWQQADSQQKKIAEHKEYWIREFSEESAALDLPTDFARPLVKDFDGGSVRFETSIKQTEQLRKIAVNEKTTMFTVLLSLYNILLSKLTNQQDIVVGTPVAGRNHPDVENMLGMFVNTLPLRNKPASELSFREFLTEVKTNALLSFDHQDYPYEELIDALKIQRDVSRNPLFDALFAYENFKESQLEIPGLTLKPYEREQTVSKFDITLSVHEDSDKLTLTFEYADKLFLKETVERFAGYFTKIIAVVTSHIDVKINEIEILPESERSLLLKDFNNTRMSFNSNESIVSAFEKVVEQHGNATALTVGERSLSFSELNEKSNHVAYKILALGAKKEDVIGIMLSRSEHLIISIIGVLKAGCAYVPVDPDYPIDRIKYILEDSGSELLLSEPSLQNAYRYLPAQVQLVDVTEPLIISDEVDNVGIDIEPSNLAYVIYTSGSTGKPKGVMIEHSNVLNFVAGVGQRIAFEKRFAVLSLTTVSFDIFVLESLFPLLNGLRVVLANSEEQKNVHALTDLIIKEEVDAIQITPSHLKLLLFDTDNIDFLDEVKVLMIGGEALPDELLSKVKNQYKGKIYNMYGPTETTVWSTISDLTDAYRVDIGEPLGNTLIRILDSENNLQPVGVPGDLYIGGMGVARGYFNDPLQTMERFITDPITDDGRVYKTGDIAKWLPDGSIAYLGRVDNQVKIRGFRIELGEIESHLLTHNQIEEAVVVAKQKGEDKFLTAYYVSNEPLDVASLRNHMTVGLPGYMVPSYFVSLVELPLTPNGKLDRKALPSPEFDASDDYQAPVSKEEKQLTEVWSQVLGKERVGITDNFFMSGGDSIKSIQIGSRLRKLGYEVTVQDVFIHQTISALVTNLKSLASYSNVEASDTSMQLLSIERSGDHVRKSKPSDLTYKGLSAYQLEQIQNKHEIVDIYPLSPMQEGMLFHSLMDGQADGYIGQVTCKVSGALNIKVIEKAMNLLIVRHEVLRTSFLNDGYERPLQLVHKERKIEFQFADIRTVSKTEGERSPIERYQLEDRSRGFDLFQDVLMRLVVLQTQEDEYQFIWSYHHILMDGWCMDIIAKEFQSIYHQIMEEEQVYLPSFTPYSRYIQWLEKRESQGSEHYWTEYLKGYEGVSSLPQRDDALISKEALYLLKTHKTALIDKQEIQLLKEVAAMHQVTPNMIFQLAWSVLLARYNNTDDVVFGSVVSGRPVDIDGIENMIGLFINTIPVRAYLGETMSVSDVLKQLQTEALNSVNHHHSPLSEIQDLAGEKGQLFDHILTFENVPVTSDSSKKGNEFQLILEESFIQTNYDLSVTVYPDKQYQIQLDYNANRHKEETINTIAHQLRNILRAIVQQPNALVKEISLYDYEESLNISDRLSSDLKGGFDGATLQHKLQHSFTKYQQNIALEYGGDTFTYAEIDKRVNKTAHLIDSYNLTKGTYIGVLCEDRYQLVCAVLGILKAGMAFVPLDMGLPKNRLSYMVQETGLTHVITDLKEHENEFTNIVNGLELLTVNDVTQQSEDSFKPRDGYQLADVIYTYFTSGSTGNPKGVVGKNESLSHFVQWEITTFQLDEHFRFSQFTNPGFDAFLRDLFVPLCVGATLCIPDEYLLTSGCEMADWIEKERISLIHCVPSTFKLFNDCILGTNQFKNLQFILLSGEKILPSELEKWYQQHDNRVQLVNLYGATETTLVKGAHLIKAEDCRKSFIPVKPMDGCQFLVLDKQMNLCPIGVTGEICIRTPYMTYGYLNLEELTKKSFAVNPFGKDQNDLIYRTGDLGKEYDDGTFEILGRNDQQIKIRGIRIELDEIRQSLIRYPEVSDAVVVVREDDDAEKLICAYLVSNEELNQDELRDHLSSVLPKSMIPSYLISIPEIPLTRNGKVDRNELPEPGAGTAESHEGASNETEAKLIEIWSEVLKMDKELVSITKSFFEMGGQSLKLLLFLNRINKHYGIKVPIQKIFEKKNIQQLADYLIAITEVASNQSEEGEIVEISI